MATNDDGNVPFFKKLNKVGILLEEFNKFY